MKNSKICPKCNSSDIRRVNGSTRGYGAGNNILIGMTIFSSINVARYVCLNCGYTEEWIDKEDIERLKNCKRPRG